MSKLIQIILALIALLVVGAVVFLATWDMPAPKAPVERVVPNDKLPQ